MRKCQTQTLTMDWGHHPCQSITLCKGKVFSLGCDTCFESPQLGLANCFGASWYPHGFFMNHNSRKTKQNKNKTKQKTQNRAQNCFSLWGPFYEVVGTYSNLTMKQTVTQLATTGASVLSKAIFSLTQGLIPVSFA